MEFKNRSIHVLVFLSSMMIGSFVACNERNVNQTFFPLTEGNSWTYEPSDPWFGEPFVWTVTERHGDTVSLEWLVSRFGPISGPIKVRDVGNEIDLLFNDTGFVPFKRLTAGATWLRRDAWECDDSSSWIAVKEKNPIVTPAGTFKNCLRIGRRTPSSCPDAGTMMEWWAPGIGLVRWDELNYYARGVLTFSLKSYSIN